MRWSTCLIGSATRSAGRRWCAARSPGSAPIGRCGYSDSRPERRAPTACGCSVVPTARTGRPLCSTSPCAATLSSRHNSIGGAAPRCTTGSRSTICRPTPRPPRTTAAPRDRNQSGGTGMSHGGDDTTTQGGRHVAPDLVVAAAAADRRGGRRNRDRRAARDGDGVARVRFGFGVTASRAAHDVGSGRDVADRSAGTYRCDAAFRAGGQCAERARSCAVAAHR